jgi:hypothetical protein
MSAAEKVLFRLVDWMQVESLIRNASKPNRGFSTAVC